MLAGWLFLCGRAGAPRDRIPFRPRPFPPCACSSGGPFRRGGMAWGPRPRADTRPSRGLSCLSCPASDPDGCRPVHGQPLPRLRAHLLPPCFRGPFAGQAVDFERRCRCLFRLPHGSFRAYRSSRRPGCKTRRKAEAPDHGAARSVASQPGRDGRAYKRPTGGASQC